MSRATELARLALCRHEVSGTPLDQAIAEAIQTALDEVLPPPVERIVGRDIGPRDLVEIAGIDRKAAYARLRSACALGQARRVGVGRYRVTTESEPALRALVGTKYHVQRLARTTEEVA